MDNSEAITKAIITSDSWDLRAILRAGIGYLFVAAYSTRIRGGFLRFQSQYLRRIRVPHWQSVPPTLQAALIAADEQGDEAAASSAVRELYNLSDAKQTLLG